MPIVTTSSHRRRGAHPKNAALPITIVAILAIAAGVAYFLLREKPGEMPNGGAPGGSAPPAGRDGPAPKEQVAQDNGGVSGESEAGRDVPVPQEVVAQDSVAGTEPEQTKEKPKKPAIELGRRLRHGSEQLLAMIISTEETGVPPLPISPEDEESLRRDLLAAITNDIVIFDDEDAKTQDVKERVADAKRQLADILKKGGSVVEAIREYEAYVNEGAKVRSEVLEKVAPEVEAIEDDAKAVEYVESVNEALKKEGVPPIKLEEVGFEKTEVAPEAAPEAAPGGAADSR